MAHFSLGACGGSATATDHPVVLAPPPLIFATAYAAGALLGAALPGRTPGPPGRVAGAVLLAAGLALAGWFVAAFVRARTPVDFRPARRIVTTGPYRFSRNPGYLGMALAYVGIALLTGTPWPLLTLVPALVVVDRCVVVPEERHLAAAFGTAYDDYRARTRRWL